MEYIEAERCWRDGDITLLTYSATEELPEVHKTLSWLLPKFKVQDLEGLAAVAAWGGRQPEDYSTPIMDAYDNRARWAYLVKIGEASFRGGHMTFSPVHFGLVDALARLLRRCSSASNWEELLELAEAQRTNATRSYVLGLTPRAVSAECFKLLQHLRRVYAN